MDPNDKATELEELDRQSALALHQRRSAAMRLPAGVCANCDEPLAPAQHFCDASCRHDFDRRQAAARRNGS